MKPILVVGADLLGKTTFCEKLKKFIDSTNCREATIVHSGSECANYTYEEYKEWYEGYTEGFLCPNSTIILDRGLPCTYAYNMALITLVILLEKMYLDL